MNNTVVMVVSQLRGVSQSYEPIYQCLPTENCEHCLDSFFLSVILGKSWPGDRIRMPTIFSERSDAIGHFHASYILNIHRIRPILDPRICLDAQLIEALFVEAQHRHFIRILDSLP